MINGLFLNSLYSQLKKSNLFNLKAALIIKGLEMILRELNSLEIDVLDK